MRVGTAVARRPRGQVLVPGQGWQLPARPAVPPSLASSGSDTHSSLSEHVGVFLLQGLAL